MSENFDLKEQIREYWSARADDFDDSFSHQITDGVELDAWKTMYAGLLGADEKHILDLGCGTGEISKVLFASGHRVTGLDFSEAMLAKARSKHADKGDRASFLAGDVEMTLQPDAKYDAVTCRHVVWTLLDPQRALEDWFRVLKPGGHLVIFDGNFMQTSFKDRLLNMVIGKISNAKPKLLQAQDDAIRKRLPFANGLGFGELAKLADQAGYEAIHRHSYLPIRRAQRRIAGPAEWLRTFTTERFVLHATKPS
ncbi:MAG: class I SAM-dependent methyltransferase [Rhodobacteraceae bacterium]|nr:class I SAM-dependent methyltransferase [Paracoccaceae bacterium]